MSYLINDLFNFEAIDRLFPQRSNFFLQKQTKDVICSYEYCLMCYNKCLIFISKQEKEPANMLDIYQSVIHFRGIRVSNVFTEYKFKQVFN